MAEKTYTVLVKLKTKHPREVDDNGNPIFWNSKDISNEITSWLDDLGFDSTVATVEEI